MPAARIQRTMVNIASDDLPTMRDFYTALLDFEIIYESDWYIVLMPKDGPRFELGIIARGSKVTPPAAARPFGGAYLTFVVADVLTAFEQARAMGADIIEPPTDTPYGQRRMLIHDPAGAVIDISSPSPQRAA